MADVVREERHFRVSYKFPKQKAINMNYTAPSVAALMRNLQMSENVNSSTVEFLYVHQILDSGSALELVAIDKSTNSNVTNIKAVQKSSVITGEYDDDDDDQLLGYPSYGRDALILQEVTDLLTKQDPPKKPRIILKSATPPFTKGFHFVAKPAKSTVVEA